MKSTHRRRGVVLVRVALAVAASTASGGTSGARAASPSGSRPTRRRTTGKPIVAAANAAFEAKHPGVTVNVQYQTWGTHLQKFDATLAGGNAPGRDRDGEHRDDEVHGGGRLPGPDRRQGVVPELGHLARRASRRPGVYNGKTYGVPYYAGSRVVTYRTDLFKKAGIKVPTTLAQFQARREARRTRTQEGLLARLHRGHRLVLRDELRLRLRRRDRHAGERQVEGPRSTRRSRSPA